MNDKRQRILIVDDNPSNIQVVANLLSDSQYSLAFARDGESALEQASKKPFDLILMDIMMPGMDGFECCKRLKANPQTSGIPLIFLTAKNEEASIIKGFECGGVDYITKPFNSNELLARVNTHLRLQRIQMDLLESNQTKDKLFSLIAHDLRSPIGGVLHVLNLLTDPQYTLSESDKNNFLFQLNKTVQSTFGLINNLLLWARNQRGMLNLNLQRHSCKTLLDPIGQMLGSMAQNKGIELDICSCKMEVTGDREMLTSAVQNLVSNSIKFTPKGGKVTVRCQERLQQFILVIEDTGIGMSKEQIERLFTPDHKSTPGTSGEKGTGLGLLLCFDFIQRHQGEIKVQSQPQQGTRIELIIPQPLSG